MRGHWTRLPWALLLAAALQSGAQTAEDVAAEAPLPDAAPAEATPQSPAEAEPQAAANVAPTLAPAPPAEAAAPQAPAAPVARVAPVADTYFGETLTDPYRWMENNRDPDWLPWLHGQDAHTRAVLGALPGRDALLARVRQLSGDTAVPGKVVRIGARIFYQQRPAGASNFRLYVREQGRDRVLVDPTALDAPGSHVSLDWWSVSPDGARLVYGLSKDGSEDSTLQILQVATGHIFPERIADTEVAWPSWLADGSGFFYSQLTGKVGSPQRYLDARARFHRVGTDPERDPILVARGHDAALEFEAIQVPSVRVFPHSSYAVLTLSDVRAEHRVLVAPLAAVLAGKAHWENVAGFEDEVTDVDLDGERLVLLSTRDHPRGHLLATSARRPDLSHAHEWLAESALVLKDLARAQDGLYVRALDGGVSRLLRVDAGGHREVRPLPFDGTLLSVATDPAMEGALLVATSWLQPPGIWSLDARGHVMDTGITPRPDIDTTPYMSTRLLAKATDGTVIPYTVIHRRGLALDGSHPAFVSAYGSYGASPFTPFFQTRQLALIDRGAIVAYANVRGGGEFGREWHRAGQLANKPNTWRDLIAVCQDMITRGYTAPAHLAIGGRSAGGITVGRAMTERPDLFAAVVSGVGWHNPLRYVAEQDGYGEEPEWGAIASEAGYRALKSIDSYQAVTDGAAYPAVLLTTGVTDPRVAPFHPAKMAARLQAATSSGKPVLLRVDFDAGHGIGSTRAQQDSEAADTYAFILWQTQEAAKAP